MNKLTYERTNELLNYCPNTGIFTRKISLSNSVKVGQVAGFVGGKGYIYLSVDGKSYLAHRLAWLITFKCWPNKTIDHINGIKTDNRLLNLRSVSAAINNQNKHFAQSNSASKILGVSWMSHAKKWRAQIQINKTVKYLGLYANKNDAQQAYLFAKRNIHIGCTI